jgi:hypothetical protein
MSKRMVTITLDEYNDLLEIKKGVEKPKKGYVWVRNDYGDMRYEDKESIVKNFKEDKDFDNRFYKRKYEKYKERGLLDRVFNNDVIV